MSSSLLVWHSMALAGTSQMAGRTTRIHNAVKDRQVISLNNFQEVPIRTRIDVQGGYSGIFVGLRAGLYLESHKGCHTDDEVDFKSACSECCSTPAECACPSSLPSGSAGGSVMSKIPRLFCCPRMPKRVWYSLTPSTTTTSKL